MYFKFNFMQIEDDLYLASQLFGKQEFDYFCYIGIGKSLFKSLMIKHEIIKYYYYSNYSLKEMLTPEVQEKLYIEEESLFSDFIAKSYVDYILPSDNINLIIKNKKIMEQYILKEIKKCLLKF